VHEKKRKLLTAALLALWTIAWAPSLFADGITIFDDLDERLFHYPTIRQFAHDLPWPHLHDYQSATTPLYHLLMSPIALAVDGSMEPLRLVNLLLSVGAIWACIRVLTGWGNPLTACVGALLVCTSPYFVGPAIRLSTDNAALLFVFLLLSASHPRHSGRHEWAALFAAAAVLTRQIHLWVVVPIAYSCWIRHRRLHPSLGGAAVPIAVLVPFALIWGGLTPPSFADGHQRGLNPDALVMFLGVLGAHSWCVSPWLGRSLCSRGARLMVPLVVLVSFGLLAAHAMPWVDEPSRIGGAIWSIARFTPALLDVPAVFWVTVPAGAVTLLALWNHPSASHGRFLVVAAVAFAATNMMSGRAYQKYYDPMALFLLAAYLQAQPPFRGLRRQQIAWALPIIWSVGLLAVTLNRVYG